MSELKFKKAEDNINLLLTNLKKTLNNLQNKEAISLSNDLIKKLEELKQKIKLEIAFVGQYSSGKSTIISALTKNKAIKIGQDITTDKPKAYSWGSVYLVDTPGIYAGRPDHDKLSLDYMNKADLLVYVITTQGFSSETAKNFKSLAIEENRIEKTMLVINKSSQGNKRLSLEYWISDALKVTKPKTEKDLFLSVIDAKYYLKGQDFTDKNEKQEYIEYSGFNDFIDNLNNFISQNGILGRLLTPLNLIEEYLNNIIALHNSKGENDKAILELLERKNARLNESKRKITNIANDYIDNLVSNIKTEGNKIASLIEKNGSKEILEAEIEKTNEEINYLSDETSNKLKDAVETEFSNLKFDLDILMSSELAQALLNQEESFEINYNSDIDLKGFNRAKAEVRIGMLNNIGDFATKFAVNKEAVEAGAKGLRAISGSEAHKTIYQAGKFFGHKFKPYEAVKYADKVSKVGNVISKSMIVLPFLIAGYEEYRENKHDKLIKEERLNVRNAYNEVAREMQSSFKEQFDVFLDETYNLELNKVKKMEKEINTTDKYSKKDITNINNLLNETKKIMASLK